MFPLEEKAAEMLKNVPELHMYRGKTVVIKFGGNAMSSEEQKCAVLEDISMLWLMGIRTVLCHGGGPGINRMLEKLEIPIRFINGLRYTSEEIMRVVEMVLIGQVNTELVNLLEKTGARAVGLSGVSGDIFHCHQKSEELGCVGEIDFVDTSAITALLDAGFIPVIAPIGTDGQGATYNINGDTAAGKLAGALQADRLILLTDIEGLCNSTKLHDVISYLNVEDIPKLKDRGTISGGMIPKIDGCAEAVRSGVRCVQIIDGRKPHSILPDAFQSESGGTAIGIEHPSVGITPFL